MKGLFYTIICVFCFLLGDIPLSAQQDTSTNNNKEKDVTPLIFGLDISANMVKTNSEWGGGYATLSPKLFVEFKKHTFQIGPDILSLSRNIIGWHGGYSFNIYKHNKYNFFTGIKWQSVKYISGAAQSYNINFKPEKGDEDFAIWKNKISLMSFGLGCRKNIGKYLNVNIMLGFGLNSYSVVAIRYYNTKELINANHLLLNIGLGTKLISL